VQREEGDAEGEKERRKGPGALFVL